MQIPGLKKSISIITVGVLVLLIFFIIRSCGKTHDKEYIFDKVTVGEVKKTISVTGELNFQHAVTVLSKVGGVVKSINAAANQHVNKGQLICKIDSDSIDQRIKKTQSSLESVKYEILSAEKDLEGKKNLYKDNLISKNAMEQAEMQHKMVLLKYKQVKLDYDIVMEEKTNASIFSPISGIVITVYTSPTLPISVNANVMLIASGLDKMTLIINIDESDIGRVKIGQNVYFTVSAFPDKVFTGVINNVMNNPVKSGALVSYQAIVLCNNNELLLKSGMTATATVVIEQKSNVLRVQNQAFIISPEEYDNEPGKKIVWKKTKITASKPYAKAEVKQGLVGDMYTEVINGLKAEDEVLVRIKESKK